MSGNELIGRIEHNLDLSRLCDTNIGGEQSKRSNSPLTGDGDPTSSQNISGAGSKRKRNWTECKSVEASKDSDRFSVVGFFFILEDSFCEVDVSRNQGRYRLIVPHQSLHNVIDAARFQLKVTLTAYCIVDIEGSDAVIEIHNHGITTNKYENFESAKNCGEERCLSLKEFQEIETQMQSTRRKKTKLQYHIKGMVDSTTPIIGNVPTDPFAMVELYDPESDNNSLSAVVILKGASALICQPGLHPGTCIMLSNVTRQRWHVPQSFQQNYQSLDRLHNRAPSHVFVVANPKNISWGANGINRTPTSVPLPFLQIPLPSTIDPLTSFHGRVTQIQYTLVKQTSNTSPSRIITNKIVHYIVLKSEGKAQRIKLFLTYFPLSPSICVGLQQGAYIRAVNVHRLHSPELYQMNQTRNSDSTRDCFGACLRSTVSILACATECSNYSCCNKNRFRAYRGTKPVVDHIPFSLKPISQTYLDLEWISVCKKQLSDCYVETKEKECVLRKILGKWRQMNVSPECIKYRDPYVEWFDHACEEERQHEDDKETYSCPCSLSVNLPFIIGMSKLKEICMMKMGRVLMEYHQKKKRSTQKNPIDRAEIGWTASVHLHERDIIRSDNLSDATSIMTGGKIATMLKSGEAFTALRDAKCQLTFSACWNSQDPTNFNHTIEEDDFVLVKVDTVVLSCLYLGRYTSCEHTDENKIQTTVLPSVFKEARDAALEGPTQILQLDGHCYIVSIQIRYNFDSILSAGWTSRPSVPQQSLILIPLNDAISCPLDSDVAQGKSPFVLTRLVRQRWKIQKCSAHYSGCQITISHTPNWHNNTQMLSHSPQTLDIKLKIPLLQDLIRHLHVTGSISAMPNNIKNLACAWQYLAETCAAPISSGGWDEFCCPEFSDASASEVHVLIPLQDIAPQDHENHKVDISSIRVRFSTVNCHSNMPDCFTLQWNPLSKEEQAFTYFGGRKVNTGMLDIRINRCILHKAPKVRYGEALVLPHYCAGVSSYSIASMKYWRDHKTEIEDTRALVKIENACLTTLRYCRAKAECTRCFKSLSHRKTSLDGQKKKQSIEQSYKPSFWNNPLPLEQIASGNESEHVTEEKSKSEEDRAVVCPSGCDARNFIIKWELSGILLDNTGTAKVYAERDAAVLILGRGLDIDAVEEGAWNSLKGITFQIGVPMSNVVKNEVSQARLSARRNNLTKHPFEQFLSPEGRANYVLHEHCRRSHQLHRRMDFICRRKILKGTKKVSRFTDISLKSTLGSDRVTNSNDISMTLPLMELQLVDCFRSYQTPTDQGWKVLESLKD